MWIIELELCNDDVYELNQVYQSNKILVFDQHSPFSLAAVTSIEKQGEYDIALAYYRLTIELSPDRFDLLVRSYKYISLVYLDIHSISYALEYQTKALEIQQKKLMTRLKLNYDRVLDYLLQVLNIYKELHMYEDISRCCDSIGEVYFRQKIKDIAINYHFETLKVIDERFPSYLPYRIVSYEFVGKIYQSMRDYEQALKYYNDALNTKLKYEPLNDPTIVESYEFIAALNGHDMVVREIISRSANKAKLVELEGRVHSISGDLVDKVTALWCALDRAHFSVAHTLINLGKADVNHGPLHPLLVDATIKGRLDIVEFLVENGSADINQTKTNDENKSSSLIVAASHDHTQIIEYLLKKNVELESKTCVDENTALAVAAMEGHLESMDHSEISFILHELNLSEDCVANIYNHGSYAQGTCTPKSDRDLIIVTRSCQNRLWFHSDFDYFHGFELHKLFNKYDVCIYSVENFQLALEKNYLFCVQCLFLPDEFKIKEEIDFRTIYLEKYYNIERIKQVAFYEMLSSFNLLNPPKNPIYPKRSSTENEINQPLSDFIFKNLFHGIRFLDIGEQLIQTRSVYDFTRVSYILNEMKDIRGDPTDESNKHRVVEYVRKKSAEFKSKLDALVPTNIIKGTFKVYITFNCKRNSEQVIEKLKKTCQNTKYKIAFIQLCADQKKKNLQQLIAFSYYHGEYPSIIEQIERKVHEQFKDFNILRIQIKSLASNEGVPQTNIDKQLFWNEKSYYFEFHYRIILKRELDGDFLKLLQKRCESNSTYKLYLSPYAFKQIDHKKFHYIIIMRLFDVGRDGAIQMNYNVVKYDKGILCLPSNVEPEFIVYDTNMDSMNIENV
ncbi:unnamed protein product [Rotaria sp. Silwood1]|nr:unnamed protein product [Rotaria sp. Silwood1]CAF4890440.1 unnamed protein product [Rotaria sp. Silwood1]